MTTNYKSDTLNINKERLHRLFRKFYADCLSDREKAELEDVLESSSSARELFHNYNTIHFAIEAVETDKDFQPSIYSRLSARTETRRSWRRIAANIAAAIALPLILLNVYTIFFSNDSGEVTYSEVASVNSKVTHVILPDGSKVSLFSGSILRYPERFAGGERRVELKGEATFEVRSDELNPFYVSTLDGVQVKAYGTKFNVCGYEKENTIQVYLMKGAVDFIAPSLNQPVVLRPETCLEYGRFDKSVVMRRKGLEEFTAREQGILMFRKTSLRELILKVSRMHGVEIVVENDEILQYTYTGSFKDESVYQIMDIITQSSPRLKWSIVGETIFLSKK